MSVAHVSINNSIAYKNYYLKPLHHNTDLCLTTMTESRSNVIVHLLDQYVSNLLQRMKAEREQLN